MLLCQMTMGKILLVSKHFKGNTKALRHVITLYRTYTGILFNVDGPIDSPLK